MVANIGPSSESYSDTQNCLNFASKSRKIVNTTTIQRTCQITSLPRPVARIIPAAPVRVVKASEIVSSGYAQKIPVKSTAPTAVMPAMAPSTVSAPSVMARPAWGSHPKVPAVVSGLTIRKESSNSMKSVSAVLDASLSTSGSQASSNRSSTSQLSSSISNRDSGSSVANSVMESLSAMTPGSKSTYVKACIMKAKLFHKMGRLTEALEYYEEAQALFPDSEKLEERIEQLRTEVEDADEKDKPAVKANKPQMIASAVGERVQCVRVVSPVQRKVLNSLNVNTVDTASKDDGKKINLKKARKTEALVASASAPKRMWISKTTLDAKRATARMEQAYESDASIVSPPKRRRRSSDTDWNPTSPMDMEREDDGNGSDEGSDGDQQKISKAPRVGKGIVVYINIYIYITSSSYLSINICLLLMSP